MEQSSASQHAEDSEHSKKNNEEEFKKPVFHAFKLSKRVKNETEATDNNEKQQVVQEPSQPNVASKSSLSPAVLLKELSTPIPYKEPKWSGLCPNGTAYSLEVIKSGLIVENISLCNKPYYVFGRLANCDVVLAHPTISRHHSVLQYKAFSDEGEPPPGWYMYDLGSTHGTFLNKQRLKSQHYTRLRVGHQFKFGNSTRTYIMLGPDFDCEGESELTVTEIKIKAEEMRKERDMMIQEAMEQREKDRLVAERKREEQGIDWGMGEDAEEEPDLTENPYAVTANEDLYLTDPKKTLRGYFEREGHDLVYDCEERGAGQFMCRVEIPIDDARGRPVIAEVIHRGKKKEAVVACALEACRLIDRAGLLRQAKHESRRRKQRDWSADDYYDSDDDTFLDRTGSVERKRSRRMQRETGTETDRPVTYDDLLKQISEIESKISTEEKTLELLRALSKPVKQAESEIDALDEYMTSLGRQGQTMAQKAEISQIKRYIQKLRSDLSKTQRLAELARPAHLPPLIKKSDTPLVKVNNSVVYGKRIRLKDVERKPRQVAVSSTVESEFVEEMDSDEDTDDTKNTKHTEVCLENNDDTQKDILCTNSTNIINSTDTNEASDNANDENQILNTKEPKKMYGPMRPPENYIIPENYFDQESDRDLPEIVDPNEPII